MFNQRVRHLSEEKRGFAMSSDKNQMRYQTYKPEHPVDEATRKQQQEEIRNAARHAAQQIASEELGDKETGT
ncbi:MAG TPA: hypothetical protein VGN34_20575, partial [Ktedonobacteraceae bacterium]